MLATRLCTQSARIGGYRSLVCLSLIGIIYYFMLHQDLIRNSELSKHRVMSTHDRADPHIRHERSAAFDRNDADDNTTGESADEVQRRAKLSKESDVPCTFALFRQYYEDYGYFPGDGQWNLDAPEPYFQPDFCKFRYRRMNRAQVSQCFGASSVKSIMTLGDSNAQRYFEALKKSVATKQNCRQLRRESSVDGGFMPDKSFYQPNNGSGGKGNEWEKFIAVNYRMCKGCGGQQHECTMTKDPEKKVKFEHMSMNMLVDDTVQISVHSKDEIRSLRRYWSPTSQETLFKYFLKGRYPDIFVMFLPFNHAKHLKNYRLYMDIQYFVGMIRFYFPTNTKVVFMPTFSEFESLRKAPEWVNVTFDDMLAAEKIDHINHMLFDATKEDLLNPNKQKYGFLDLLKISKSRLEWSTDGIHMQPVWYDIVVSMLWETVCNSIQYNAF